MPFIKHAPHHLTFKTNRLDEMMAWYRTVLGSLLISVNTGFHHLRFDEAKAVLDGTASPGAGKC
jgi:catechol 2,3-dioxygenase-like lactoylglutathione lyase family enzyme